MSTVNNVRLSNLGIAASTTSAFRGFFDLTRALKKAGWKYKASANGTTKLSNADPATDLWGAGQTSNAGASAASIAAPSRGRAVVTGLTGIVAADKGRFLLISGAATGANNNQHQIEEVISSTSVAIDARNFAVASDANNGSLTWSIKDPLGDTWNNVAFASGSAVGWWCAQGPSVLKIPITAGSTGTFSVGENLVQSSTGAEGELLGYTYYNGTGWLVVAPRLRGTGGGVWGWATGNTVTGGRSGATVAQSGTAIDYVWEVVFYKDTVQTSIQIFVGQFNTAAESAEMFSFCATQAGATATIMPGGGGTGNAFGAHAWVMWGSGTTTGNVAAINAENTSPNISFNNANIICVDCIPEQNYTADGSWILALLGTTSADANLPAPGSLLYGLQRLNNTEDGDVCVYATVVPPGVKTLFGNVRTGAGGTSQSNNDGYFHHGIMDGIGTSAVYFGSWVGRGTGTAAEAFADCEAATLSKLQTGGYVQSSATSKPMRMVSTAAPLSKYRERLWLTSTQPGFYMIKGNFRWVYWVSGDQITDTYGLDPGWVQVSTYNTNGSVLVIGPHDGSPWSTHQGPN